MIKRPPTRIELKYDDDISEYEEMKKSKKMAEAPPVIMSQPAILSLARPLFGTSSSSKPGIAHQANNFS